MEFVTSETTGMYCLIRFKQLKKKKKMKKTMVNNFTKMSEPLRWASRYYINFKSLKYNNKLLLLFIAFKNRCWSKSDEILVIFDENSPSFFSNQNFVDKKIIKQTLSWCNSIHFCGLNPKKIWIWCLQLCVIVFYFDVIKYEFTTI